MLDTRLLKVRKNGVLSGKLEEKYIYSYSNECDPRQSDTLNGITTQINRIKADGSTSSPDTTKVIKKFFRYKSEYPLFYGDGKEFKTRCYKEITYSGNTMRSLTTNYTRQTFWPTKIIDTTLVDGNVMIKTTEFITTSIHPFGGTFRNHLFVKNTETIITNLTDTTYTVYKNFVPENTTGYIYMLELPDAIKKSSGGIVKEHIKNEYYETLDFEGKLKKSTLFPETNRSSFTQYSYYPCETILSGKRGLLKEEESSNGTKKIYEYPHLRVDSQKMMIDDSVIAKKALTSGSVINNYVHAWHYQYLPIKTTLIYNSNMDTLVTYCVTDGAERPIYQIEPNGFLTETKYDEIGRTVRINTPGDFLSSPITDTLYFTEALTVESSSNYTIKSPVWGVDTTDFYTLRYAPTPYPKNEIYPINSLINLISEQSAGPDETDKGTGKVDDEFTYYAWLPAPVKFSQALQLNFGQLSFKTLSKDLKPAGTQDTCLLVGIARGSGADSNNYYSAGIIPFQFIDSSYYDLDIRDFLQRCKDSSLNLAGFCFIANNGSGQESAKFSFSKDARPKLSYSFNYRNLDTCALAKSTLKYNFMDGQNYVDVIKRKSYNQTTLEQVKTRVDYDVDMQPVKISAYKDNGALETRSQTVYNYLGLEERTTDALGRYVYTKYDGMARPVEKRFSGMDTARFQYSIDYDPVNYSICEITKSFDEEGKESRAYINKKGLKVLEERIDGSEVLQTKYNYDAVGRLTSVISPENRTTSYEYDELGFMRKRISPDDSVSLFYYDKFGNLRFTAHQTAAPINVSFCGYDDLKRMKYKGTAAMSSVSSLNPDSYSGSFETDTSKYVCVNMYDKYSSGGVFGTNILGAYNMRAPAAYKNYKGRLVATAFRDKPGDGWSYKLYGYDYLGRPAYTYIKICGITWKEITNTFDNLGNVTKQAVISQGPGSGQNIYYWYDYDDENRLVKTYSSMDDNKSTARIDISYTYNAAGQDSVIMHNRLPNAGMKQVNSYDMRGRLSVSNLTDVFYQGLSYYRNGNVKTNFVNLLDVSQGPYSMNNNYEYDGLNRLRKTKVGNDSLETYLYDGDGNITRKWRSGKLLSYKYSAGTNRLDTLTVTGTGGGTYKLRYDYSGNVVAYPRRNIDSTVFDERNLPLKMKVAGSYVNYRYDDNGNRIIKQQGASKEFYLTDMSGRELAIYSVHEGDDTLRTVNLFGNGATGRVNVNWSPKEVEDKETGEPMWITVRLDDPVYYVKDHLGSIKATLNTSGTTVFAQNTYPYGEIVPGQSYEQSGSGQQRYDFTGKERDVESGLNYFGARYYDSELGRWLSIDPLGDEFPDWSPYNYCFDNPVNVIDPDGMEGDKAQKDDGSGSGTELPSVTIFGKKEKGNIRSIDLVNNACNADGTRPGKVNNYPDKLGQASNGLSAYFTKAIRDAQKELAALKKMKHNRSTKHGINSRAKTVTDRIKMLKNLNKTITALMLAKSFLIDGQKNQEWGKFAVNVGLAVLCAVQPEVGIPLSILNEGYEGGLIQMWKDMKNDQPARIEM